MSSLVDCCSSCCTTPAPVYVVGSTGATGVAGADGINAFTTITTAGGVSIPAIEADVVVGVADNSWAGYGQTVFLSDGTDWGTFTVKALTGTTSMTLTFVGATGDAAPGANIAQGGTVSPTGRPGAAVADPLPVGNGGTGYDVLPEEIHVSPADPTETDSLTEVMMGMGLNAPISFTPKTSGKVLIIVTGMIANATLGNHSSVQLRYGTGIAPDNGVAATGTALGKVKTMIEAANTCRVGFALSFVATGLTVTPATAYWIDCGLYSSAATDASIHDIDVVAIEL